MTDLVILDEDSFRDCEDIVGLPIRAAWRKSNWAKGEVYAMDTSFPPLEFWINLESRSYNRAYPVGLKNPIGQRVKDTLSKLWWLAPRFISLWVNKKRFVKIARKMRMEKLKSFEMK
jgi:hypothetical protein